MNEYVCGAQFALACMCLFSVYYTQYVSNPIHRKIEERIMYYIILYVHVCVHTCKYTHPTLAWSPYRAIIPKSVKICVK